MNDQQFSGERIEMSDRFPGSIYIGGPVSRSLLQGLALALRDDGASLEFMDAQGLLHLSSNERPYPTGAFGNTTKFCKENGIPYDLYVSATCDTLGEKFMFRPGMDEEFRLYVDEGSEEIVDGSQARKALSLLIRALAHIKVGSREYIDNVKEVKEAKEVLEILCPDIPDALAEFQVVG